LRHAQLPPLLGGQLISAEFLQPLARLHVMGEFDFLSRCKQRNTTDVAQIPADGIGVDPGGGPGCSSSGCRTGWRPGVTGC